MRTFSLKCRRFLFLLFYRQLEESYLNQYSDSEEDTSDVDEIEEGLQNCELNSGEGVFDDDLYCVACNKFFNSDSAKLNHEASKKHKQNTELLKMEMNAEEESYQEKVVNANNDVSAEHEDESDEAAIENESAKKTKAKKSKKKNKKVFNYEISDPEPDSKPEQEIEAKVEDNSIIETKADQSDDEDWSNSKKAKKTKTKSKPKADKTKVPEPEPKQDILVESKHAQEIQDEDSTEHRCASCKETFQSKNKLFAHLKKTNHSIYLGDTKSKVSGEKPSSRKKK